MNALSTLILESPIGPVGITASDTGLRRVALPARAGSLRELVEDGSAAIANRAASQLEEYFAGKRQAFDLPLDWTGVESRHRRVLEELVDAAPYGHTVTYGQLGARAGEPDPREVGIMMARNPLPLVVPCHRVLAADGLGGYGGGLELKRTLLELEQVLPPRLPLAG